MNSRACCIVANVGKKHRTHATTCLGQSKSDAFVAVVSTSGTSRLAALLLYSRLVVFERFLLGTVPLQVATMQSLAASAAPRAGLTTGVLLDDDCMYLSLHADAWATMGNSRRIPASCVAYCEKKASAAKQDRKVFFGGVSKTIDSKAFKEMMLELGKVQEVWLAVHPGQKTHRGFGFAVFKSIASIDTFMGGEDVQTKFVRFRDGEMLLDAKRATPKSPKGAATTSEPATLRACMTGEHSR